jgi:hypothetical protein
MENHAFTECRETGSFKDRIVRNALMLKLASVVHRAHGRS